MSQVFSTYTHNTNKTTITPNVDMVFVNNSTDARSIGKKEEMSEEDFKKWLKRFDSNRDGRITVEELRNAIKASGGWFFCTQKAKHGMKKADENFNGVIDDTEIGNLVEFAQKHMGVRIIRTH